MADERSVCRSVASVDCHVRNYVFGVFRAVIASLSRTNSAALVCLRAHKSSFTIQPVITHVGQVRLRSRADLLFFERRPVGESVLQISTQGGGTVVRNRFESSLEGTWPGGRKE